MVERGRIGRGWRGVPPFFSGTVFWTLALLAVPAVAQVITFPPDRTGVVLDWLFLLSSWMGLFLPFTAFAGGVANRGHLSPKRLGFSAGVVSILSFLLLGYASPHFEYMAHAEKGLDIASLYPLGPETVGNLSDLRATIEADPPAEFSFSLGRALESPPNWILYRIHASIVLSLLAVFSAFLGALTASLTNGLSPPARKNARWAIGLISGLLFFVAITQGGEWVRASPLNSGILGAWCPLLLPAIELGFLALLRSRKRSTDFREISPYD